mmetsp:Transcript_107/g.116  ORF Transcript_107/g.116 Transcript_107/m.116 type:complete len:196 (-) Transcript_107:260-847(-)
MEVAASYLAISAVSSASLAIAIASDNVLAEPMSGRVFFKSLISLPIVRCLLQLNPKRAVETENPNIPNIIKGCSMDNVLPLKMVTSRMFAAISRDDAKWSGSGNADKEVEGLNCVLACRIAFGLVVAGLKAVAMLKKPGKRRVNARILDCYFDSSQPFRRLIYGMDRQIGFSFLRDSLRIAANYDVCGAMSLANL